MFLEIIVILCPSSKYGNHKQFGILMHRTYLFIYSLTDTGVLGLPWSFPDSVSADTI